MAKTSINPEDPNKNVTTLVPTSSTAVGAPVGYDPEQYDDVGRDIEVPTLVIVNSVGPTAKKFKNSAGLFAFGDILLGSSVNVIPVAVLKFFSETHRGGVEIKHGSELAKNRKRFASASEAAKAGYIVGFKNDTAPNRVQEAAVIGYLVVAPEGDKSGEFVEKCGDLRLARAKCTYQRGGYRGTFQPIFNHAAKVATSLDIPTAGKTVSQLFTEAKPWTHLWTLTGEECAGRENQWWETRASKTAPLAPEVVQWITDNYGDGRI